MGDWGGRGEGGYVMRAGGRARLPFAFAPPPLRIAAAPQTEARADGRARSSPVRARTRSVDKESFAEEEGARSLAPGISAFRSRRAGDRSAGSTAYCSAISRVIEVLGEGLVRARTKTTAF